LLQHIFFFRANKFYSAFYKKRIYIYINEYIYKLVKFKFSHYFCVITWSMIFIIIAARDIRCSRRYRTSARAHSFYLFIFFTSQPRSRSNSLFLSFKSRYLLSLINFPLFLAFLFPRRCIRCIDEERRSLGEKRTSKLPTNGDELPAAWLSDPFEADFSTALIVNAIFIASH